MNPKGIVIVDDDTVMRLGLKMMIDWELSGFTILGEAENGLEALSLIERTKPSIVITDMKMPVMDGVSLIRALKNQPYTPKILALSSYDEFDLVRESMRLGAADYLLKMDLTSDILLQALQTLAGTSETSGQIIHLAALRTQLVKNIVSRFFLSDRDLHAQEAEAGITFSSNPIWSLAFKTDLTATESQDEEDYRTMCLSLINIAEEIAHDNFDAFCVESRIGEFFMLGSPRTTDTGTEKQVLQLAERLCQMVEQYLDLTLTIGISNGANSIDGLFHACSEARVAAIAAQQKGLSFCRFTPALYESMQTIGVQELNAEVRQLRHYIDQHFTEELSLPDLAQQLQLSPGYLSALMKKQLGLTFSEYVLHMRMEHARELLTNTTLRVYEVAERVGYNNQFYFSKLFKRAYGISPGDYRHKNGLGKELT